MKRLALFTLSLALANFGHAFSVNPMVSTFDPNAPRSQQVFVLTNPSENEKPIEIVVAKPILDENGIETMDIGNGSENFLIVPQQFVLPPNARRSVKAIYVGDPRDEEDTYRFIFRELPVELATEELPEGESSFNMRIVLQYNTRVWLTPAGLKEDLSIASFDRVEVETPASVDREGANDDSTDTKPPIEKVPMLRLTVANTGPAHGYLRYPEIALVQKDGSRYELSKSDLQFVSGQVVMKESQKDFRIRWRDDFPDLSQIERIDLKTGRR